MKQTLNQLLNRHRVLCGIAVALLLSSLTFVYNLTTGPLVNLNDIGSWSNRLLFTALSAIVHISLLLLVIPFKITSGKMVIRQLALTFAFLIFLLAINQKTFAYTTQVQPMIRQMDSGGLSVIGTFDTNLSVPMLTLYYMFTRGPIYDMYLAKLFAIACYEFLCLCVAGVIGEQHDGWAAEAVLCLSLILPQGFLSAACAAQMDVFAFLLAVLSWKAIMQGNRKVGYAVFGVAAALCGAFWFCLPVLEFGNGYTKAIRHDQDGPTAILTAEKLPDRLRQICIAPAVAILCCLPAVIFGCPAGTALGSLLRCVSALPVAGAGVPSLVSYLPRALVEEMPQYAFLRPIAELDTVTWVAENYMGHHFEILMHGLSFANLAVYMGLMVYAVLKNEHGVHRWITGLLIALMCMTSLDMSAWMLICILCIAGIVIEPRVRIPAALLLFATAGGSAYPVAGEVMLSPALQNTLCLIALGMLLGIFDVHWIEERK